MSANQIRAFHHIAYRCRDSEATRAFYEDFIGLELAEVFEIGTTATGRAAKVLHSFYRLADGSFLAFFEAPDSPFDFRNQHDFDLHLAMEVSAETLQEMLARGRAAGIETRGPSDHGIMHSIYFRDPNGYVVELTVPIANAPAHDPAEAHATLADWQRAKAHA